MITPAAILFSFAAAALVWLAGRRDAARDPRLTVLVLALLAAFPLLSHLPKVRLEGAWVADLPEIGFSWVVWLGWVWAVGVVLFAMRLVVALVQLTQWRRRSVLVTDADFANHQPEIRMLDGLVCPVAAGVLRPLILVPPAWRDWTPALRKTVIAHEAAHHARHDPLWRAIAAVACTLHWWNPLVWWMAVRLADQCEFACDERVVSGGLPPRGYAGDLLDVAAVCRAPATTLAMAGYAGLEARVQRMVAPPQAWSAFGVTCFAALALTGAVALAMIERGPADYIPSVDAEEIRTRLTADPFAGN